MRYRTRHRVREGAIQMSDIIGIICPGAFGDIALATGVLHYRNTLWPNSRVRWYVSPQYQDMAFHPGIDEVRLWNGKVDGHEYADCARVYKAAAWLCEATRKLWLIHHYRMVFDMPHNTEWHPCLDWIDGECQRASEFIDTLPKGRVNVMLETQQHSNQSLWDAATTAYVLSQCRKRWPGRVNVLMASYQQRLLGDDTFSCAGFTVRQCCLLYNQCHAFFGCSSGISAATCNWESNRDVKRAMFIRDSWSTFQGVAWGRHREAQTFGAFAEAVDATLDEVKA